MTLQTDGSAAGRLRAMNPTNQYIYDAVVASPVGKAMTPDQRAMLAEVLAGDADPRAVQGWLGEQIRKAAASAVAKGDYEGHPFRGNQWSNAEGQSQGGAGGAPQKTGKTPAEQRAEERDAKGKGKRRSYIQEKAPEDGKPKVNAAGKKIIDYNSIDSELEGKDRKEFDSHVADAKKAIKVVSDHLDSLEKRAEELFSAAQTIGDRETRNKARSKAGDQTRTVREARWQLQQAEKVLAGLKPTVKGAVTARVKLTDFGELAKGLSRDAEDALDGVEAQIINDKSRLKGMGSMTPSRVRAKREASMPKSRQKMPETALQDAGDKWFGVNNEDWDLSTAYDFIDI